jgi:FHS family L-fucose permease-like MFS transporter
VRRRLRERSGAQVGGGGLVLAVVYVTALFFIWALVTNLLDPLLKTMKTVIHADGRRGAA